MAIAHVQDGHNENDSTGALSITVSALTAGNLIVVGGFLSNETRTLTPSATGVTFTTILGPTNNSSGTFNIRAYLWIGVVDSGGATTVTLTANTGTTNQIHGWVSEFSGLPTSSYLDQSGESEITSNSTSHNIGTSLTTTQADELLIANYGIATGTSGGQTAGGSYTLVHSTASRCIGEWRIVSATGTYDCPITTTQSRVDVTQFVTLKAAAAGGAFIDNTTNILNCIGGGIL